MPAFHEQRLSSLILGLNCIQAVCSLWRSNYHFDFLSLHYEPMQGWGDPSLSPPSSRDVRSCLLQGGLPPHPPSSPFIGSMKVYVRVTGCALKAADGERDLCLSQLKVWWAGCARLLSKRGCPKMASCSGGLRSSRQSWDMSRRCHLSFPPSPLQHRCCCLSRWLPEHPPSGPQTKLEACVVLIIFYLCGQEVIWSGELYFRPFPSLIPPCMHPAWVPEWLSYPLVWPALDTTQWPVFTITRGSCYTWIILYFSPVMVITYINFNLILGMKSC